MPGRRAHAVLALAALAAATPARASPAGDGARLPWLVAELGAFAARRELRFDGAAVSPAPLREHTAPAILGPHLRVEVRPAAPFTRGAAAGLAAFGGYRTSVGLETAFDGGPPLPTSLTRLSAGARWRAPPLGSIHLALAPAVSFESLTIGVEPAIPGLPDARLAGVKAGLEGEIPLGGAASVVLGGGLVRWTTARELVAGDVPFFPGGTAFALEAEAALSVAILRGVSAVLAAEYAETRYALERDASGMYRASSATDRLAGVRLAFRARL